MQGSRKIFPGKGGGVTEDYFVFGGLVLVNFIMWIELIWIFQGGPEPIDPL